MYVTKNVPNASQEVLSETSDSHYHEKTDFLTDFLRYTYSSDMSDSFCKKAAPICLMFSLLVSVVLTMFHKGSVMNMESAAFDCQFSA